MIEFEWDPVKARKNLRKHGVAFDEAVTVFGDPLGITIDDPDHSGNEERYITIGASSRGRVIMVAHCDRGRRTRLINARELTRKEQEAYESEGKRRDD